MEEREKIGRKDKHGKEICRGDIILGEFFGMGGRWIQKGIVYRKRGQYKLKWKHVSNHELVKTHMETMDFTHPKFCKEERREIIGHI